MKYSLRLNAVFDNLEELKTILQEVIQISEQFGLDGRPNCGSISYDFDIYQSNNKDVYQAMEKQELNLLLRETDACGNNLSYKEILDNLEDYVDTTDIHYHRIKQILTNLTKEQ